MKLVVQTLAVVAMILGPVRADVLPFRGKVVATNRVSFTLSGPMARVILYGTNTARPTALGEEVRGAYDRSTVTNCTVLVTNYVARTLSFGVK